MSNPILLQDEFTGIFRDRSRDNLPNGKAWDLVDYIPHELGAPIRKRGGWSTVDALLTDVDASAGTPNRVGVLGGQDVNHIFRIDLSESEPQVADSYTITFQGQTTAELDAADSAATVQAALEALSNIAPGDVSVTENGDGHLVTFQATYANTDLTGLLTAAAVGGGWGNPPNPDLGPEVSTIVTGGSGGTVVVVIDDRPNPELFDATNGADYGSVYGATAPAPLGPMVNYRGLLLIPSPALTASPTGPRKFTGAAVSALGGTPPGTRYFAIYKDRVVAASADTDTPHRVYFSAAGNAESWDTTSRWIDTSAEPIGLAPLRNMLLVFHENSIERIRGSIPPGSAAANMELEPLFDNVGLADPFALAVADDFAYWADEQGVYRTDGSGIPSDLTKQGGISQYWKEQYELASGGIALTVWRGYVWVSLLGGSDSYVDFLLYDIERRSWFRFDNIRARNFAHFGGESGDELVFANRDSSAKYVGALASVFDPTNNTIDGNSGEIEPVWETPFYNVDLWGKKRWKHIYLTHQLDDTASQNPNLTLSYVDDPASEAYTSFGSLTETSGSRIRARLPLGRARTGIGLRGVQTNRSGDTRLYAIEADLHPKEGSGR